MGDIPSTPDSRSGDRHAREMERHLDWLDTFTSTALGVMAAASGIYTYLGVRTLLDDPGVWTTFAALAYSIAVSVGIFVFWSYMLRLLPAVRTAAARGGLLLSMALGCVAIVAMSSWLNAAALAEPPSTCARVTFRMMDASWRWSSRTPASRV